ncbi:MAG: hypothetical protein HQ567_32445 [Candidatus Nealsonbacteria bacterium]|nr:hypothetical protein [Candidatus Nealsonbacteria bacterium]
MSHRRKVALLVILHLIGFGLFALLRGDDDDPPAEPPLDQAKDVATLDQIDVASRELTEISPGTQIVDCPPQGWSHLIIKSWPHIGPETIDDVSDANAAIVSLLFTAIVADVQQAKGDDGKRSFHLAKVGIGVGADVDGRHLTLTPDTQKELGADLGWMDRRVLIGGRDKFRKMRCVARSNTMALLDSPEILLHDGEHRPVILRYALLLDAATGRLDTLLWALNLDEQGNISDIISPIHRLPSSKVEACILHADPDKFVLGVPTAIAFAMTSIPEGKQSLVCPASLKPLVTQSPPTPHAARQLQRWLRKLVLDEQEGG